MVVGVDEAREDPAGRCVDPPPGDVGAGEIVGRADGDDLLAADGNGAGPEDRVGGIHGHDAGRGDQEITRGTDWRSISHRACTIRKLRQHCDTAEYATTETPRRLYGLMLVHPRPRS